jgi:hypothetical protein
MGHKSILGTLNAFSLLFVNVPSANIGRNLAEHKSKLTKKYDDAGNLGEETIRLVPDIFFMSTEK